MIPRIIHYCWFGRGEMPQLAKDCIASWHKCMPDWEYKLWNEDNFDVSQIPYAKEAYEAKKYAFVSDYVRLWALYNEGGVYLDTDVEVFKSFDDLLFQSAFAGFEGSKHMPLGTCVMASLPEGIWVTFPDGSFDLTTNVQFITANMKESGFVPNGREQCYKDLHVYPVEYFCPRHTTGEYIRTEKTYCDHLGMASWAGHTRGWKAVIARVVGPKTMTGLIKLKRKLFG